MTDDWTALVKAAYVCNAGEHAMDDRHLKALRHVRTEDDGSIIVELDRHPSHDGRCTVGELSPAYSTVVRTYRVSAAEPAFELIDEENLGLTFHVDALAAAELETLWDVLGDELREAVADRRPDESVSDICRAAADDWGIAASWSSEYIREPEFLDAVSRVRTRLVELLVARVTGEDN